MQPFNLRPVDVIGSYHRGVQRRRDTIEYERQQEALRQEAEKNAFIAEAYRRNYDPATGSVNTNALMSDFIRKGYGALTPELRKTYQGLEQGQADIDAANLKLIKDRVAYYRDLAPAAFQSDETLNQWADEVEKNIPGITIRRDQRTPEYLDTVLKGAADFLARDISYQDTGQEILGLSTPSKGLGQTEVVGRFAKQVSPDEASRAARDRGTRPLGFREAELQLPTGEVVPGVFDPNSGQYAVYTEQGFAPVPSGTRPVTASTNTGYIGAVQKGAAERDVAAYNAAKAAQVELIKDYETLDLLESGQPSTGLLVEFEQFRDRLLEEFDGDSKAAAKASDTQFLNALLGSDVFANIQALGIGARGLDTPAEREFLREVVSGTTKLTPDTLRRMANLRISIKEHAIKDFNRRVEAGELDVFLRASGLPRETIPLPSRQKRETGVTGSERTIDPSVIQRLLEKYPEDNTGTQK